MRPIPLYVIDNDGKKIRYPDWEKIPIDQLKEFEHSVHKERIKQAIAKGKSQENVRILETYQILRNLNRNEQRRNNLYKTTHLQPGCSEYCEENGDDYPTDMDNLGKYSSDYSTIKSIADFMDIVSIKQTLISGGLKSDRVDLLIRCEVIRDKRKNEIAAEMGIDPQILTMRLQRIKTKAKRIITLNLIPSSD